MRIILIKEIEKEMPNTQAFGSFNNDVSQLMTSGIYLKCNVRIT